jgi:hypothetical protein
LLAPCCWLSIISLNVLSTIRAYVGGEVWSKARKMPSTILAAMPAAFRAGFSCLQGAIAIQLGDRQARLALDRAVPDLDAARAGLLQGAIIRMISTISWPLCVSGTSAI